MIVTVCSFKGGVGKTTTAIHVAAHLSRSGRTLLVDADANRSAVVWGRNGRLPFAVVDERQATRASRDLEPVHTVIDTAARPDQEVIDALAAGCDFLIVPTTPDALSLAALMSIADAIARLGVSQWRVLLTMVAPPPVVDGAAAREQLQSLGLPIFEACIRRRISLSRAALRGVLVGELPRREGALSAAEYEAVGAEIPR